jgi:DNA-binding NarL/FixJ family response regulator
VRLSARQLEVLQRLLQAKPNKVICKELGMAEGTVRAHVFAIYSALGLGEEGRVNKRVALMERAHRLGLVDALPAPPSAR